MSEKLLNEELSRDIIGAAMDVLNALKPGLDEKIYENALIVELVHRGRMPMPQSRFVVKYRDHVVGTLVPDLIVDDLIVVDTKVVSQFNDAHIAQMIGYLAITGKKVGLLINFHDTTLQWKRIVR